MKKIALIALWASYKAFAMETDPNQQLIDAVSAVAYTDDVESARKAILKGADLELSCNELGWKPLIMAVARAHTKIVTLLLRSGADVNGTDLQGETALFRASRGGYCDLAKTLLLAGADVNAHCVYGRTAFTWAQIFGFLEMTKLLLASGATVEHWHTFQTFPVIHALKTFLENPKKEIDAHPESKNDYLVWSIAYKQDEAFNYLLEKNHELLASTNKVIEYFLLAARVGNVSVFTLLKSIVKDRKPQGAQFIYLKALDLINKLHPELLYLMHQVLAEDIAPTVALTNNRAINSLSEDFS